MSVKSNNNRVVDNNRPEPKFTVQLSQADIKDLMRNHRSSLCDRLLTRWLEAYTQQNSDKDVKLELAIIVQEIQNIDIMLRLTSKDEKNKEM